MIRPAGFYKKDPQQGEVLCGVTQVLHASWQIVAGQPVPAAAKAAGWDQYDGELAARDALGVAWPAWVQPEGAHDAYRAGALVTHGGQSWISLIDGNAAAPGVSGWRAVVKSGYAAWVQPTGAHDAYGIGERVTHGGKQYESLIVANVWEPNVYPQGWRELVSQPAAPSPWVQPQGTHDAYALGALVTHAGKTWQSTVAANVWEPGVFGWAQV